MRENPNPYTVLGVTPTATKAQITHAYRARLRALHPDSRNTPAPTPAVGDTQLQNVLAAYALLRKPNHRADDDRTAKPTTSTQRRHSDPPAPPHPSPNPQGPVQIPVSHHATATQTPAGNRPPLWAGPVRQHPTI